jgi:hypothetical protein
VLFCCPEKQEKPALRRCSTQVINHPGHGRPEMSTIMKNKSLLLLPIGLAVLIVISLRQLVTG